jgi:hypothetical protein
MLTSGGVMNKQPLQRELSEKGRKSESEREREREREREGERGWRRKTTSPCSCLIFSYPVQ